MPSPVVRQTDISRRVSRGVAGGRAVRRLARRTVLLAIVGAAAVAAGCTPYLAASPGSGAGATATPAPPAALPVTVSPAEALQLRDRGAFVLDVRQPSEFAAGHIPGATLIPVWDLSARIAEVPRDRQVLVVCRSGARSAQGRDILLAAGYPSVTSMQGGMTDWTAAGYPTTTDG